MSRTALFGSLRRSFRLARSALRAGWSTGEAVDRWREARSVTRREALALGSAALVLPACRPWPWVRGRISERPRVVIVGAGIAGLCAAFRLRQAGVASRVFEAQERIGGRMFSLRGRFADGQVAELGGELIDTGHLRIRELAAELGVPLDDLTNEDPSLEDEVWFFEGRRFGTPEVIEAFRPIAARIAADLDSIGDAAVSYQAPNGAEALDRMTIAEWLDRSEVTGWIRRLLDVAYTTEYGREIDEQSSLNLLLLIDPEPDPFRIFGESDERFHVHGGNDRITSELGARLPDQIETGTILEAVSEAPDGSYRCSFRRGFTSLVVGADHLILAVPFTTLRRVRLDVDLPPVKRRAIDELGYGTNAKLMVGFRDRLWRTEYESTGSVFTDLPFQLTWDTSRGQTGRSGILTNFTGGRHGESLKEGTAADQARRFTADLERVFPGARAAHDGMTQARFHWPSNPWALGSYACYLPGQWTAFGGVERERVGRIHFAGEHASAEAQGFMEGGCETGEAAAAELLADLGRRAAAV